VAACAAMATPPPERALDVALTRLDGTTASIGSLARGGPLLVVLTRHFGCPGCSRTVTELVARLDELAALGVRVAVVGPGSTEHARGFLARHGLPEIDPRWELLCDPDGRAYAALEMHRSTWGRLRTRGPPRAGTPRGAGLPRARPAGRHDLARRLAARRPR
jgi:peroxiredoxin